MTPFLYVVGALTLIAAVNVVFSRSTIYSALSLVVAVGLLSLIYLMLNAQFLFVVQLIIYAGAVMVLFVFIIALLSPSDDDRAEVGWRMFAGLVGVVGITGAVVLLAVNGTTVNGSTFHGAAVGAAKDDYHSFAFSVPDVNAHGNIQTVGGQLFTTYVLPFEITSLVLLVAVVGAVYLTRRSKAGHA